MRFKIEITIFLGLLLSSFLLALPSFAQSTPIISHTLTQDEIIKQLGWVQTGLTRCGGYYAEAPFTYSKTLLDNGLIQITSDQLLFAQKGTSEGQGRVTITRYGQQIISNKAYLYRDPVTGKLSAIELEDHVILREPNSLVVATHGHFDLKTKAQSLYDILYRTAIYSDAKPAEPNNEELQKERKINQLSAWGKAADFKQDEPKIYKFTQASYSTCPPNTSVWQVKASKITLDKNSGRGTALNARVLVKGVPVFYTPYFNFPIDSRRKTGFLWPTVGSSSSFGSYLTVPFYWNMAPNYDMTITPAYLDNRGVEVTDLFRYLTPKSSGNLKVDAIPYDFAFANFKNTQQQIFQSNPSPQIQSELTRLEHSSTARYGFEWLNSTQFNNHWSDDIDYNYVSDDYFLKDFSNNLNQITQNQLLQQGQVTYKGINWGFTGRIQGYQTLHPVNEPTQFYNQYIRLPQLILNGDYPENNPGDLEYFVGNELTRFDIRKNPGSSTKYPIGDRLNIQPGIAKSFSWPYLTITPRVQLAMTKYQVGNVANTEPKSPSRVLPIGDITTSLYFERYVSYLSTIYKQTLEPQFYYTYIPFKNQSDLPVFDTTVSTLTYDQLFMYNRFSGIDRINDANQVALGLTSRFINQATGEQKITMNAGQIIYFQKRKVTLCTGPGDPACPFAATDFPGNSSTLQNRSPLTGGITYNVNPDWSANAGTIWNSRTDKIDNQTFGLHYQPPASVNQPNAPQKIINLGYNFVRNGDILPGEQPGDLAANLSSTDASFDWPLLRDWSALGRWTQNWNHHHFQNLLYGLQYDSCCWAVRFIAGRAFTGLGPNTAFQYNTQFFIQIALKGLGTVPIHGGDPNQVLTANISGITNNFGRDF